MLETYRLYFATLLAILGLQGAVAAGTAGAKWKAPRTEHGHPDLQGVWDFGTATPFQRPANLGDKRAYSEEEAREFERKTREANAKMDAPVDLSKGEPKAGAMIGQEADMDSMVRRHDIVKVNGEYRTSILIDPPDGRLPTRKGFRDVFGELVAKGFASSDGPESLDPSTRCLAGLPVPSLFPWPWNAHMQIVQAKDHIVLFSETNNYARIVRLGGEHRRGFREWMGDSVAHWEGATLVVHTINFRPEQSFAYIMPMSEDFELTERFTRVGENEILYAFTAVDLKAYTAPFTGERIMKRASPRDRVLEFACHEGNYGMEGILRGARKLEANAAARTKSVE